MTEEMTDTGEQTTEAAAPVDAGQSESQNRQVPLEALESERAQRQSLQEELKVIKDHIALMQSHQNRPQAQAKDDFDGMTDDDVLTVGEFKKAISKEKQQYEMSLKELKMVQQHPDYQEVVTKYLPDVLKQNPGLRSTLEKTQDYELAYYLARNSESYKKDTKQGKKSAEAERILENSQKAGSLSAVGSTTPMNQAKRYKDMSDSDFMKQVQKNLGYY